MDDNIQGPWDFIIMLQKKDDFSLGNGWRMVRPTERTQPGWFVGRGGLVGLMG